MDKKGPYVRQYMTWLPHTIETSATLARADELMREYRIRHLPAMAGGKLVGILSQRDIHLFERLSELKLEDVKVGDAMTTNPIVVSPGEPLSRVAQRMATEHIGSVLVADGPQLCGIFTSVDALVALVGRL